MEVKNDMSFFEDDEYNDIKKIMKKMIESFQAQNGIDGEKMKGAWNFKEIDEPDIKGYIMEGRFYSDHIPKDLEQPLTDSDPEPSDPSPVRRPFPRKRFEITEKANIPQDSLADVYEQTDSVKIYIEIPGQNKEDIQINFTDGNVEIRAKNYQKTIKVPTGLDKDQATTKYNNGVLTLTIPKKQRPKIDNSKIREV